MKRFPLYLFVVLLLMTASTCTTYLGVATDKESQRTYITYTKAFLFFGTSGVILCERQGEAHVCRKVDVWPIEAPQVASSAEVVTPPRGVDLVQPVIVATPAAMSPEPPKTRVPLPVKAEKSTGEMVLSTSDALTTAATALPAWQGSYVVIRLKDGRDVHGGLALVSGMDLRVRTESGTWSGTLTDVERMTRY